MEKYTPGIGFAAGNLMIKWNILDTHIKHNNDINKHINVFINFESIIQNCIKQKNLNSLVNFHKRKIVIELESAILNLIANYKSYFVKNKYIPHIYLYNTSFDMDMQMKLYNEHYREYYHNQYTENPQFSSIGNLIKDIIIPEIKLILSYVPNCYYIESKTFDGSIIPYVISSFNDYDNIIITTDIFDTMYLFNPNFKLIYIKRRYSNLKIISTIDDVVLSIIKHENPFNLHIFRSELYYKLLLSIKGSKIRNIKTAKGFGYVKFITIMKDGIDKDVVLRDYGSIDSIIELFPNKYRNDIKNAFKCTSIENQYMLLNDIDFDFIKSQIIDKSDISSLESLNNKRFLEFPINIQGLIQ